MATHATRGRSVSGTSRKGKKLVPLINELRISTKAVEFAKRIGVDPDDVLALRNIECGLHSGFPECCVLFFVTLWSPLSAFSLYPIMDTYKAACKAMGLEHPGYVMCPGCLIARNVVKVKRCNCSERLDKLWPRIKKALRRRQVTHQAKEPSPN